MRQNRRLLTGVASLVLYGVLLGWGSPVLAERGQAANGKKLYLTYCFLCHGTTGKGDGYAARFQPVKPRNLTEEAYMSTRTEQQLFEAISGGGQAFHGAMTMPYWRESLTEQQIWDLVAYIRTLHRQPPLGEASHGATIYADYCWTCHGKSGKGDGPIAMAYQPRPRDLTDRAYMSSRTDDDLYNAISQGGAAVERSVAMPGWGQVLPLQDIWDLVAYIRQLSGQP
jgi:cytochrome c oxidase cbb3-type subunit 3